MHSIRGSAVIGASGTYQMKRTCQRCGLERTAKTMDGPYYCGDCIWFVKDHPLKRRTR